MKTSFQSQDSGLPLDKLVIGVTLLSGIIALGFYLYGPLL